LAPIPTNRDILKLGASLPMRQDDENRRPDVNSIASEAIHRP
jgi:hypothetical protein